MLSNDKAGETYRYIHTFEIIWNIIIIEQYSPYRAE